MSFTGREESGHVLPTPFHDSFTNILTYVYKVPIYADAPLLALACKEQITIKQDFKS